MQRKDVRSKIGGGVRAAFAGALACVALAACTPSGASTTAEKQGELGNGAFLFACDNSVACDRWSTGNAERFPDAIATGSTFGLYFLPKGQTFRGTVEDIVDLNRRGVVVTVDDRRYEGVTVQPIGPNISDGPDGFSGVQPGYATAVARDNAGTIIDYVTLKVVQPDALVVYAAAYEGTDPLQVQAIDMTVGTTESYRTVASHQATVVAGAVRVAWSSADPSIAQIESYDRGVVRILAKGVGTTTVTAVGAALEKRLDVEVKP